jgi:Holliday junction resolvase RusA-like endonuclease
MRIECTIPGEPVGKGRPRFTRGGHTFTPEKTRCYEQQVALLYRLAAGGFKFQRHIPVTVEIRAYYAIPRSDSVRQRSRKLSGDVLPCKKPDADNVVKIILDALNGLAYEDDAQVVELWIKKEYAEKPRVHILVYGYEVVAE